jgi:hypothetical protein
VSTEDPTGSRPVPQPPPLPGRPAPGERTPEELTRTVLALAAELADLRAQVQDLTGRLDADTPANPVAAGDTDGAQPGFIAWADMDPGQRAEALGVVRDWVHEVLFVWHPAARKTLRACWYRHRDLLSDTAALYEVWCFAYRDPAAPPARREQWHSAWLPGWLERVKALGRACAEVHDPRPLAALGPEWTAGFDEFAAWFADPRGQPEPGAPVRVPAARDGARTSSN